MLNLVRTAAAVASFVILHINILYIIFIEADGIHFPYIITLYIYMYI